MRSSCTAGRAAPCTCRWYDGIVKRTLWISASTVFSFICSGVIIFFTFPFLITKRPSQNSLHRHPGASRGPEPREKPGFRPTPDDDQRRMSSGPSLCLSFVQESLFSFTSLSSSLNQCSPGSREIEFNCSHQTTLRRFPAAGPQRTSPGRPHRAPAAHRGFPWRPSARSADSTSCTSGSPTAGRHIRG